MTLYEYILKHYEEAEPIFFSDVEMPDITKSAINQQFKKLCDEEKVKKFDTGVYYLHKEPSFKHGAVICADVVALYKYVSRNGIAYGFYAGGTFVNQMGLSTQVPQKVEIVTNGCSSKLRTIMIQNSPFIIRKPVVPITNDNVHVLQLLDLLKHYDTLVDEDINTAKTNITKFIHYYNITKQDIDLYIDKHPLTVYKAFYDLELHNVFTPTRQESIQKNT